MWQFPRRIPIVPHLREGKTLARFNKRSKRWNGRLREKGFHCNNWLKFRKIVLFISSKKHGFHCLFANPRVYWNLFAPDMTPTAMNWNYSQKVLLQTILNTWSFFWQPSKKKQMAPTTSIAHDLQCHATCACTDCSPLNHIAQVLLRSDFWNVKDTQLVWGHKKGLTLKLITRLALKCKWSEDDISFLVSAYFQGWTVSQMRLSFDLPGMSGFFFKLVTRSVG